MNFKFLIKFKEKRRLLKELKTGVRIMTQLDVVLEEYLKKSANITPKNFVVVRYVKKDSDVVYMLSELLGSHVNIKDTQYIIDSRAIQFLRGEQLNLRTHSKVYFKVPVVDVYEGRIEAVSSERWCKDVSLSEEFQKLVYLELERGIMMAKKHKQHNIRQMLIYGMIAVVALVIVGSIFFK